MLHLAGRPDKPHADESAKAMKPRTKTRQSKKVALVRCLSLLASASYVIPFLVVSRWRIILGMFVEIELSH